MAPADSLARLRKTLMDRAEQSRVGDAAYAIGLHEFRRRDARKLDCYTTLMSF